MSDLRIFMVAAFDIVWALAECVASTNSSASRAMTRAKPWMEIVWRIFLAAGWGEKARKRPAGLVLTFGDIAADGARAILTTIQPDNFAATTILPFANMKIFPGHQQPL